MGKEAVMRRNVVLALALVVLAPALACTPGCGRRSPDTSGPEYAPIVPGYALAGVDMETPFREVRQRMGEPDEHYYQSGYIHAFYGRLKERASLDDPEAWHFVLTFLDDGDRELGDDDAVGQVEAGAPYHGTTVNGNGLESTPQDFVNELGEYDGASRAEYGDATYVTYTFARRGFGLVAREEEGGQRIVTLIVTPHGGLKPAREKGKEYEEAVGDIFRDTGNEPVLAGASCAGIDIGDNFLWVKDLYGLPNLSGSLGEGLCYASYTGGTGGWKLNIYLEDTDGDRAPGDFDPVISIGVRAPYAGRTPKGTGIGSRQTDVTKEFGPPEFEEKRNIGGDTINIWQYQTKGIVFAVNAATGEVVEIDVNRI
jgi:hypothetical protein